MRKDTPFWKLVGRLIGLSAIFVLGLSIGQTLRPAEVDAADQATRVARSRQAVHNLRVAFADVESEFQAIVDEGGLAWLNAADPALPGDTASEAIAARQAIVAIRAVLDDNSRTHEKSLVRFEN